MGVWGRRPLLGAAGAVPLAALGAAGAGARRAGAQEASLPAGVARIEAGGGGGRVGVYATPGGPRLITRLPEDAQLRVTGEASGPDGEAWLAVRLWNALDGFVRREALAFSAAPLKAPAGAGTGAAPWKPPQPPAQGPFSLEATAVARTGWEFAAAPDGPGVGSLTTGERRRVTSWATDGAGRAWYGFATAPAGDGAGGPGDGGTGWVLADALTLEAPPRRAGPGGAPPIQGAAPPLPGAGAALTQGVAGKAMWFTYDAVRETPPEHLVATALANGLSVAYVAESVRLIRARTGQPDFAVAVLGQTFDWFTRHEIGPGNPTADELRGAMQGARDASALGIGFFNWFSTTPEEWEAIGSFGW